MVAKKFFKKLKKKRIIVTDLALGLHKRINRKINYEFPNHVVSTDFG